MTRSNGQANGSTVNNAGGSQVPPPPQPMAEALNGEVPTTLLAELEVPFEPWTIEWRVIKVDKDRLRGLMAPYADQRAYIDKLNQLLTPAGWTRRYSVHTSANFERAQDKKVVAKVFVTCELTLSGIGCHSATGEEWADDENAGTAAEAQAFKRAAACFGLGRYLYYFSGNWVDVDARHRPKWLPQLPEWATPDGWRRGLRPAHTLPSQSNSAPQNGTPAKPGRVLPRNELLRRITALQKPLGNGMYRGLLKDVAHAFRPSAIRTTALLQKVLKHMESAQRGLKRLEAALAITGPEAIGPILTPLRLRSLQQVRDLTTLKAIVSAAEAKARTAAR